MCLIIILLIRHITIFCIPFASQLTDIIILFLWYASRRPRHELPRHATYKIFRDPIPLKLNICIMYVYTNTRYLQAKGTITITVDWWDNNNNNIINRWRRRADKIIYYMKKMMTNGVSCRPPTSFLKGPDTGCVPPRGKSTGRGETFFLSFETRDSLQQIARTAPTYRRSRKWQFCVQHHNRFFFSSRKSVGI